MVRQAVKARARRQQALLELCVAMNSRAMNGKFVLGARVLVHVANESLDCAA